MKKIGLAVFLVLLVAACGGGGGGVADATKFPRYAFVANSGDNSVSSYAVDAATGRLKYLGKAAAQLSPSSVIVDPSGRYVYVANNSSDNVSQYMIGNGALAPMTPATVAAGSGPNAVTIDPSGCRVARGKACNNLRARGEDVRLHLDEKIRDHHGLSLTLIS